MVLIMKKYNTSEIERVYKNLNIFEISSDLENKKDKRKIFTQPTAFKKCSTIVSSHTQITIK